MSSLKKIYWIYRFLLLATSIVLLNGLWQGEGSIFDYYELRDRRAVLQATVDNLESDIRNLESEIDKIKNSKDYARKVLRDKYHVTEQNESIIFFGD